MPVRDWLKLYDRPTGRTAQVSFFQTQKWDIIKWMWFSYTTKFGGDGFVTTGKETVTGNIIFTWPSVPTLS